MTLSEDGKISGHALNEGTYTFTVAASDGENTVYKKFTLNVTQSTVKYQFIEGMNLQWVKGSDDAFFKTNGLHELYETIYVDGVALSENLYRTSSGSTNIWLSKDYLNKLSVGKHTIQVTYTNHDEEVSTQFEIVDKKTSNADTNKSANTGDQTSIAWNAVLFVLSLGIIFAVLKIRRSAKA